MELRKAWLELAKRAHSGETVIAWVGSGCHEGKLDAFNRFDQLRAPHFTVGITSILGSARTTPEGWIRVSPGEVTRGYASLRRVAISRKRNRV